MSKFKEGDRVKVVASTFEADTGYIGHHGTVMVGHDGSEVFPVEVKRDGMAHTDHFDEEELELLFEEPHAPMTRTIAKHLREVGNISGVEAAALYKCRALPRRIKDLKELGWPVQTKLQKDATGQRYARYFLEAA